MASVEMCAPPCSAGMAAPLGAIPCQPGNEPILSETLRGGIYLAGRYALGVIVSLGNMLVMTWWIGPHAYGVFVTAISMVAFLAAVARGGVDTYLVRTEKLPDEVAYGTAVTLVVAVSGLVAAVAVAGTSALIRWYGNREFVTPYLLLLLTIPVTAVTGVPMAKLERALNFRRVAAIELSGQSIGLAVAAVLALCHAGVWAPVFGQIAWQVFTLVAAAISASMMMNFRLDRCRAKEMMSYGIGLTASLRVWQLRTLVNPMLVGRLAGAEAVAFVALAIRIAEALGSIRLAAGRMAIAALARLQNKKQEFCRALERALYLQVITLGPLLCGFALLGPAIVPRVLGMRWTPSLALYPFVAAGVLVNSVYNLQASALFVVGKQWTVMQSYSAHVALLAATTLVLLPRFGLAGYGWAELIACGSYLTIHRGLRHWVVISYGELRTCIAVFLTTLFLIHVFTCARHIFR